VIGLLGIWWKNLGAWGATEIFGIVWLGESRFRANLDKINKWVII